MFCTVRFSLHARRSMKSAEEGLHVQKCCGLKDVVAGWVTLLPVGLCVYIRAWTHLQRAAERVRVMIKSNMARLQFMLEPLLSTSFSSNFNLCHSASFSRQHPLLPPCPTCLAAFRLVLPLTFQTVGCFGPAAGSPAASPKRRSSPLCLLRNRKEGSIEYS